VPVLAAVIEPADSGVSGSAVSPYSNFTRANGTSMISAAICDMIVYVPVPISCVPA
jgi:hypothetical protein